MAEIWLSLYRAEQRSEATTANEYQRIIEKVINPAVGSVRLREATAGRLERLIRSQDSHSRRKKTKTVLKMMFDAATMHLGGRHEFSTFRLSLGSVLAES